MKSKFSAVMLGCLLLLSSLPARAEIGTNIQLHQDQIISDVKTGALRLTDAQIAQDHLDRIKLAYKRAKSDGHINFYETQTLNRMLLENAALIQRLRQKR